MANAKVERLDHFSSEIIHLAVVNGRAGGRVYHLKVAGDGLSGRLIELGEKFDGRNAQDVIKQAMHHLQKASN